MSLKGQGATEYLTIFGVVLVIALTAIVLMAFFPGLSGEARAKQSSIYWRGAATPIAITEAQLVHPGTETYSRFYFVMQTRGVESIVFTGGTVTVNNGTGTQVGVIADENKNYPTNLPLSPGQERAAGTSSSAYHILDFACTPGVQYELFLALNYTYDGSTLTQTGAKPLTLTCQAG